jgi:Lon protease-like protein
MYNLPLFPLNTVLFPGMPLPLHIFEERYKQMIQLCMDEDELFGVVLIQHGREALGPLAQPHTVGCTARIVDVQTLAEGRMNITTIGEQRFRILSLDYNSPYLIGEVELYPMESELPDQLTPAARRLAPKVKQYMRLLNEIEEIDLYPDHLPEDPMELAHLGAILLQMPPEKKQDLLGADSALDMLNLSNQIYDREIAFLRAIIKHGKDEEQSPITYN